MHWLAELDGRRVSVEVPASSANLGAGYDCLGLALGILDRIDLEVRGWSPDPLELSVEGEGADELPTDSTNCFVQGLEAVLREHRGSIPEGVGWRVEMHNDIPISRGLGSSAASVVGGVLAGNALLGDPFTTGDLLRIATNIEGHPDNAAAALLGGFTVAARLDDDPAAAVEAIRFDAPRELRAVLFIPELRLSTEQMRAALPANVPHADAVANLGRVAIGVAGLATGRHDLLGVLTVDRIHEQYRAAVFPQLPFLVDAAREAGAIGACLSGAGSTVIAFADSMTAFSRIKAAFAAVAADQDLPGRSEIVMPRNQGARVVGRSG